MSNDQAVRNQHRSYQRHFNKWQRVRNAIEGEMKCYLRNVGANESDVKYGEMRQQEYEDGAIVFNFTKRTLSGMVGSVMRKDPEQNIPKQMEYLLDDADGSGVGLWQHAQDTLMEIDSIGRGGLLVDAPDSSASTMAQQNAGNLNPVFSYYTAENIINWRHKRVGSVNKLVKIVLHESYEYINPENEYDLLHGHQYRVLDIIDGKYRQRLYRYDVDGEVSGEIFEVFPQLGAVPAGEIPFTFIGASNNDSSVDDAPLGPLSDLQIGHFKNSADNEEMLHTLAQAMLVIAPGQNISPEQWKELNPNGVLYGSRRGLNVGAGGNALLLQMQESTALQAALTAKENQAIQIGAQLITPTQQITAESARLQRGADTSVMATIARNVSIAYEDCLTWAAQMMNLPTDNIEFQLNMEFFLQPMTAQDRAQWAADIIAGNFPREAYWAAARKSGVTDWTDEDIKDGIENAPIPLPGAAANVPGEIPASAQQAGQQAGQQPQQQGEQ